jgi:hypothetical protein
MLLKYKMKAFYPSVSVPNTSAAAQSERFSQIEATPQTEIIVDHRNRPLIYIQWIKSEFYLHPASDPFLWISLIF